MAITSQIGRSNWKVRALFLSMYIFLVLGSITMVYPFLLMISGSTKSAVDTKYFDIIPRFLRDEVWLYRKHVEGLFNESVGMMNITYRSNVTAFENATPPSEIREPLVNAYAGFLEQADLPPHTWTVGYMAAGISRTTPSGLRAFKAAMKKAHGPHIGTVNAAIGTDFVEWNAFRLEPQKLLERRDSPNQDAFSKALYGFAEQQPLGARYYFEPEGLYLEKYIRPLYGKPIDAYNASHGTSYADYNEIHLARSWAEAGTPTQQDDWEFFVRNSLALQWIRVEPEATEGYHEFLRARHGTIRTLNKHYGTAYASFDEIPLIEEPPYGGMARAEWALFITGWRDAETQRDLEAPLKSLRIHSLAFLFRDHLLDTYGSLAAINAGLGTSFTDLMDIVPPQRELHYRHFLEIRRDLKWTFCTRNYQAVCDYMLFHGRGIINTVIYCSLAILCALLINPLAAYAMSRYKLPSSYKILLFLMCTMAFPPMVTAIPNFIMLRRLGLLNTFAALILPGMANGYSIFLLKGFFDAQPKELYESAQIDGASEWTLFWHITMKLSKPILAVIALQAFTLSYSNFMFAFVVCQDQKMWTLMVWLYQLQQQSGQPVMYASLLIAAIPTFLVFVFCQNIIMRGIVVPSEK